MAHRRKPHKRRYPIRQDGTRKPGYVDVNGSDVNDASEGDGGAACGCCLIIIIMVVMLIKEGCKAAIN